MQNLVNLYPIVIICSVLGFHKGFLKFLFGYFMLMDCITFLMHLAVGYELGCGFFLLGCIKNVSEKLGMFLFFAFMFRFLYSGSFSRVLIYFICNSRGKSGQLKNGVLSKHVVDGKYGLDYEIKEQIEKSSLGGDSVEEVDSDHYEGLDVDVDVDEKESFEGKDVEFDFLELRKSGLCSENVVDGKHGLDDEIEEQIEKLRLDSDSDEEVNHDEFDVIDLRKLVKIEKRKANAALEELEKERAASATATNEAMAMILRLQNEMSWIKMESDQYRRLAEEKQTHDQEVIQSLEWLVWKLESEKGLHEEEPESSKEFLRSDGIYEGKGVDETMNDFNGCIMDDLENVSDKS